MDRFGSPTLCDTASSARGWKSRQKDSFVTAARLSSWDQRAAVGERSGAPRQFPSDLGYTFAGMTVEMPGPLRQPPVLCTFDCAAVKTPTVGEHVRVLRQAAGLTQQQLADRARTTQPVIARLERGARIPTLRTLEKLARALGQDLHLLVPGSPAVSP